MVSIKTDSVSTNCFVRGESFKVGVSLVHHFHWSSYMERGFRSHEITIKVGQIFLDLSIRINHPFPDLDCLATCGIPCTVNLLQLSVQQKLFNGSPKEQSYS